MSIKNIGVVGAGQMGLGIAQVLATSGFVVSLVDVNQEALDKAVQTVRSSLLKLIEKGKVKDSLESIIERISCFTNLQDLSNCDLVIEAATENENIKLSIFEQLDKICQPSAILATNTSSLSVTKLASKTSRPEKVIGMHFMNPVPLLKLVEVINGLRTSETTTKAIIEVAKKAEKIAIPVKDKPAFVLNRILLPMINEAIFILDENCASAEDIDEIMKLGASQPIGPLALADLIGLDTCLSIMNVLYEKFADTKYRPAPLIRQMVEAGYLGRKTKRGFYDYSA
ncbi:3-hydroxybutyryl-CoA dehydrogenase [Sessilibacter sp. MAH4]